MKLRPGTLTPYCIVMRYTIQCAVIKSFKHDGVKRFFRTGSKAGIEPQNAKRLRLQLARLDAAKSAADMNLPGWRWHPLATITEGGPTMTRMHNPPHPGEVLADTVLRKDAGLTVSEFAKRLAVSRVALSRVVNSRAAVSAELAIRLAAALGGSAESWLTMQLAHDLARAEKKRRPRIERINLTETA
jgi:addiction module HigA family antidote